MIKINSSNVKITNLTIQYESERAYGKALAIERDRNSIKGNIISRINNLEEIITTKINGSYNVIELDTYKTGECFGNTVKSVLNIRECQISNNLIEDQTNIINYGFGIIS